MKYIDPKPECVRLCRPCGTVKPINDFPWIKKREAPSHQCFDCKNAKARKYAELRRGNAPRLHPTYSESEIEALRACIDAGLSPKGAAQKVGRSVHSVKSARSNYHLPKFKPQPRESDGLQFIPAIARAVRAGGSYRSAGRRIGKSRNAVSGIVFRHRQAFETELRAHEARQSMGDRPRDVLRVPVEARLERG